MKNTNRKMDFANDKINNLVKKLIYNLHLVDIILLHSSQVNFFPNIRIYIHKKIQFSITEINIEIKTTATAVIKNELKYFLMSEGNTCIAEPKLEVLPFI